MTQFQRVGLRKHPCTTHGSAIVTKHPMATAIGTAVLAEGGNAIDAAIAASFALGVVEPAMSGVGGVGLGLVCRDGQLTVLDGGPIAPHHLDPAAYRLTGETKDTDLFGWPAVENEANLQGATSVCVPTMPALMGALHERGATMPWRRLVEPAVALARDGFPPDWYLTILLAYAQDQLSLFPSTAAVFLPGGRVPAYNLDEVGGTPLRQPELADTLAAIAERGPDAVYRGPIAERLASFIQSQGGFLDTDDLASYRLLISAPITVDVAGLDVWLPDGLNGGPAMAAILHLYDLLRPADASWGSPDDLAAWIRAGNLAFEDRFTHMGHAGTGVNIADPEHAARRAAETALATARSASADSTTYLSVADDRSNAVSLNLTLLSGWGSKLIVPGTGMLMNNGMMWFDPRPGGPNSMAPGARALANMAPLLAMRGGRPALLLGASGGRRIIAAVPQILTNVVRYGMSMQEAIEAPRIDFSVDPAALDSRFGEDTIGRVQRILDGRVVTRMPRLAAGGFASPVGLLRDGDGAWTTGMDPMVIADSGCTG